MAHNKYLKFNNEYLPTPNNYDVEISDVESDSSGETEAGTIQRDVIRMGVYKISVDFILSQKWLTKMTGYKILSSIEVAFIDPYTMNEKTSQMYIDSYKVSLIKDTSYKGLWSVSFALNEF